MTSINRPLKGLFAFNFGVKNVLKFKLNTYSRPRNALSHEEREKLNDFQK